MELTPVKPSEIIAVFMVLNKRLRCQDRRLFF